MKSIKKKIDKLFMTIILITLPLIGILANDALAATATATPNPSPLTETNLEGAVITITMSCDFKNGTTVDDFILNNAPPGLTAVSYLRADPDKKTAYLTFSYNGADFDYDINNFYITILEAANTDSIIINTNTIQINAVVEGSIAISATTIPDQLFEANLQGSIIHLQLWQDAFAYTLNQVDLQLNDAPYGVTIARVNRLNDMEAEIALAFDNTDFDVDYYNFSVTVYTSGLRSAETSTSNAMIIKAVEEVEGQGIYITTGESYPTRIQVVGYNSKDRELYLNVDLTTFRPVGSSDNVKFHYFIEIFDGDGNMIGHLGSISSPLSEMSSTGSNSLTIKNSATTLDTSLPSDYSIVVTVESVDIY